MHHPKVFDAARRNRQSGQRHCMFPAPFIHSVQFTWCVCSYMYLSQSPFHPALKYLCSLYHGLLHMSSCFFPLPSFFITVQWEGYNQECTGFRKLDSNSHKNATTPQKLPNVVTGQSDGWLPCSYTELSGLGCAVSQLYIYISTCMFVIIMCTYTCKWKRTQRERETYMHTPCVSLCTVEKGALLLTDTRSVSVPSKNSSRLRPYPLRPSRWTSLLLSNWWSTIACSNFPDLLLFD